MIENLKGRAAQGVAWTGVSQMASHMVQLMTVVVLARLLSPQEFGVFGIAVVLIGLQGAVMEMGLGQALLQREQTREPELSTCFWLVLAISGVLYAVCLAASPFIARFFQVAALGGVIGIASFRLIVDAFQTVQRVVLRRNLNFETIAVAEIVAMTVAGVIAIGLAGLGWGVWSLAWGSVARGGVEAALLWRSSAWRPAWRFCLRDIVPLWPFGRNVVGNSIVSYLSYNVDNIVIAKWLTTGDLGLYRLAYTLAMFPQQRLAPAITRVAFPVLSKVQRDDARLRHGYLKGLKYISLLSFPLVTGLAVVAPELVSVVFGTHWLRSVVPVQILFGLGLLYSVGTLAGSVFLAKGRPEIEFRANVALLGVTVVAVLLGVRFGATGVAAAVTLSGALGVFALQWFVNRLIGLRWMDYWPALRPAVAASATMGLTLALLHAVHPSRYPTSELAALATMVLVGCGVYAGALVLAERGLVNELLQLYRTGRSAERDAPARPAY